ncbi:type II toxin-antitoxin system TacA family antitoxin [Methylomonas rivi]|uniref:DUF1778 domain-containing protein n=1 Tax=Methylomonas rivi TaxID=2952226 RepID=A0ABT1UA41_9GAMM|nr:DUF1778 domain-containing protein [Methylomonas sp. WSC-6]MCQ8130733.1 DUF1778 domain-containing protein [Methylomonas sp. WSC-6]
MPTTSTDYERIDLRTSTEIKTLISRAASLSGVSLSAFLVSAAQERAKQIVSDSETLNLSSRDWDAFFNALDNTETARPKLQTAADEYLNWRQVQQP